MANKSEIQAQIKFAKKLLKEARDNLKFEQNQIRSITKNINMFNKQLKKSKK